MARSTSEARAHAPAARPRIAISTDGSLAAIADSARVVVIELPSGSPFVEIGVTAESETDIAWVGTPPRLLVLARHAAHSTVHLFDPHGPRTIAEIRLASPMRLFSTVGTYALVVGEHAAAVVVAGDSHLTPYQFPARALPLAAGAAGSQFVVASGTGIEEWDPQNRLPRRRLKLPRPAMITAVGGSDRAVWLTTQQHPARIDVIPLVNRGQPKVHDLPEPIAAVSGHPRTDVIACLGAETGKLYALDLDGRSRLRVIETTGLPRVDAFGLVVGRLLGVLAAHAGMPVAFLTLDHREAIANAKIVEVTVAAAATDVEPELVRRSTTLDVSDEALQPPPAPLASSAFAAPPVVTPATAKPSTSASGTPVMSAPDTGTPVMSAPDTEMPVVSAPDTEMPVVSASVTEMPVISAPVTATPMSAASSGAPLGFTDSPRRDGGAATGRHLSERFAGWRASPGEARARGRAAAPDAAGPETWRDEVAGWARAVALKAVDGHPPPVPPIDALADRFELSWQLVPALALLYGAHLQGERGAAPVDVARVLGHSWGEALGRGVLAATGLVVHERSRVALAPTILRVLDELSPQAGTIVGEPGPTSLVGPCVVIAGDEPLREVAIRLLPVIGGAVLVARDGAAPSELYLEARARGAVPMTRLIAGAGDLPAAVPAILVTSDPALVERLGLPRLP